MVFGQHHNLMPFRDLHSVFPVLAERETRVFIVPPDSPTNLPPGEYAFCEMFCDERGCDCRRVFFMVRASYRPEQVQAVVAWGWEEVEFYAKWMKHGTPADAIEMKGPILNYGSPETELSDAILKVTQEVLLKDPEYVERVKRHYQMFRFKINSMGGKRKRI